MDNCSKYTMLKKIIEVLMFGISDVFSLQLFLI